MMLMLQEGCNHSADSGSAAAVHFKSDHRCRRPAGVCGGGDGGGDGGQRKCIGSARNAAE